MAKHYPNSSFYELLELVSPLLVSKFLGTGSDKPLIVLVQGRHIDVWDLTHERSQLHVARPLRQMDNAGGHIRKEINSPFKSGLWVMWSSSRENIMLC